MTKLSRAVIACISAIMILPDAASIAGADTFAQYHDLLHLASSAALLIMFASAIGLAVWVGRDDLARVAFNGSLTLAWLLRPTTSHDAGAGVGRRANSPSTIEPAAQVINQRNDPWSPVRYY